MEKSIKHPALNVKQNILARILIIVSVRKHICRLLFTFSTEKKLKFKIEIRYIRKDLENIKKYGKFVKSSVANAILNTDYNYHPFPNDRLNLP